MLIFSLTKCVLLTPTEPAVNVSNTLIPVIWFYLLGNVLTQYVCINSVFVLTTECSSLTVTLVLTLRKFTSLMISILYFDNPFTMWHWIGTTLVFIGTLLFTNILKIVKDSYYGSTSVKKTNWVLKLLHFFLKIKLSSRKYFVNNLRV